MATKTPKPDADTSADTSASGTPAATDRQPLPEPEGGWPADAYTGKPGNYVRDPFTGIRSPAADAAE